MNKLFTVIFLSIFISSPASAEKPEWAGTGKPTAEQKKAHKAAMGQKIDDTKENIGDKTKKEKPEKSKGLAKQQQKKAHKAAIEGEPDDSKKSIEDKMEKAKPEKPKGLAKQQQKKTEQVQKELNKGSEKGQESRQNRKKWWKFWGE